MLALFAGADVLSAVRPLPPEERDVSLAELGNMSAAKLAQVFGKAKGRRMYDFFNYTVE